MVVTGIVQNDFERTACRPVGHRGAALVHGWHDQPSHWCPPSLPMTSARPELHGQDLDRCGDVDDVDGVTPLISL